MAGAGPSGGRSKAADDLGTSAIVTAVVTLLCCPVVGQVSAIVLAVLARREARHAGAPKSQRPTVAFGIAGVGLLVWLGAFATSDGTSRGTVRSEPAASPIPAVTTTSAPATETTIIPTAVPATAVAPATTAVAPPATAAVPAGDAELLAALRIAPEVDDGAYNRDAFDYPNGGTDSRGCNTRSLVLQRDSTVPAQVTYRGCKVLAGRWVDATTGTAYEDPGQVSIATSCRSRRLTSAAPLAGRPRPRWPSGTTSTASRLSRSGATGHRGPTVAVLPGSSPSRASG